MELVLGAWLGARAPDWLALNFAMPIALFALVALALRTVPQATTAFTAAVLALVLALIPYGLGLIIAVIKAVLLGAELERRIEASA